MKASVVIPSRGGAKRLPVLLSALAAQTHDDWEALVVIDGDIDDSEKVVAQYSHLPVRCIVFPENRGRVAALNAGFAAATGEVLIRADDDFEPYPWHIAAHVAAHQDGLVGAIGLPQNIAEDNAYMRAYGIEADRRFREEAYSYPPELRWKLWGGNVSCTREAFELVGGYSDEYHGYGWEDADFGYRLHSAGVPLLLLPEAEVRHHVASVTTSIRVGRALASGAARATFDGLHGEGNSGPSAPPTGSAWQRLVWLLAIVLPPGAFRVLAQLLDLVLPVLPRALGRKKAAALIEGAAWSGYLAKRPSTAPEQR